MQTAYYIKRSQRVLAIPTIRKVIREIFQALVNYNDEVTPDKLLVALSRVFDALDAGIESPGVCLVYNLFTPEPVVSNFPTSSLSTFSGTKFVAGCENFLIRKIRKANHLSSYYVSLVHKSYDSRFMYLMDIFALMNYGADLLGIRTVGSANPHDLQFTDVLWNAHPMYFNNDSHLYHSIKEFSWVKWLGRTTSDVEYRNDLRHEEVSIKSLTILVGSVVISTLTLLANYLEKDPHAYYN